MGGSLSSPARLLDSPTIPVLYRRQNGTEPGSCARDGEALLEHKETLPLLYHRHETRGLLFLTVRFGFDGTRSGHEPLYSIKYLSSCRRQSRSGQTYGSIHRPGSPRSVPAAVDSDIKAHSSPHRHHRDRSSSSHHHHHHRHRHRSRSRQRKPRSQSQEDLDLHGQAHSSINSPGESSRHRSRSPICRASSLRRDSRNSRHRSHSPQPLLEPLERASRSSVEDDGHFSRRKSRLRSPSLTCAYEPHENGLNGHLSGYSSQSRSPSPMSHSHMWSGESSDSRGHPSRHKSCSPSPSLPLQPRNSSSEDHHSRRRSRSPTPPSHSHSRGHPSRSRARSSSPSLPPQSDSKGSHNSGSEGHHSRRRSPTPPSHSNSRSRSQSNGSYTTLSCWEDDTFKYEEMLDGEEEELFVVNKPNAKSLLFYCETCDISLSSATVLQDHFAGARHQRKLKSIGLSQSLEKAQSRQGHAKASEVVRCTLCDIILSEADCPMHVIGAQHSAAMKELRGSPPENCFEKVVKPSAGGSRGSANGESYTCTICNVTIPKWDIFQLHITGKRHLKAVKLQEEKAQAEATGSTANMPSFGQFPCHLCNVYCTNQEALDAHLVGKKHLKVLKNKGLVADKQSEEAGRQRREQQQQWWERQRKEGHVKWESRTMRCTICWVKLHSTQDVHLHLASDEHLQNVLSTEERPVSEVIVPESTVHPARYWW